MERWQKEFAQEEIAADADSEKGLGKVSGFEIQARVSVGENKD